MNLSKLKTLIVVAAFVASSVAAMITDIPKASAGDKHRQECSEASDASAVKKIDERFFGVLGKPENSNLSVLQEPALLTFPALSFFGIKPFLEDLEQNITNSSFSVTEKKFNFSFTMSNPVNAKTAGEIERAISKKAKHRKLQEGFSVNVSGNTINLKVDREKFLAQGIGYAISFWQNNEQLYDQIVVMITPTPERTAAKQPPATEEQPSYRDIVQHTVLTKKNEQKVGSFVGGMDANKTI